MSTLFAVLLVLHILFGLLGVMSSFRATLFLLKENVLVAQITRASYVASVAYILSWLSGGWYYWKYYGSNVKPAIVGGDFPWAHLVFMEAKEHVFLFLPFATLALALALSLKGGVIIANPRLRRCTMLLSLTITVLAVIVTLSGILISGGAR